MKTELLPISAASIERAAFLLRAGEVVAFPTETVYGLGANALDDAAARRIFEAKARPADNPLIAHIAELDALDALVARVDLRAPALMDAFWPGPLTLIFEKSGRVPEAVSAGLATVAVRMPSHPVALSLIRAAGMPIAAPSANRSGRPSPTAARHVLEDLGGRIPLILDGGVCGVGVESTVLDLTGEVPTVLRPGGVTVEMLRQYLPDVAIDPAVLAPLAQGAAALSPGMRHRHYAPRARLLVVRGAPEAAAERVHALYGQALCDGKRAAILCAQSNLHAYASCDARSLGADTVEMASHLFDALRALDADGVEVAIAEAAETGGMGLALMNRLLRAANFDVIDV